MAFSIRRSAVLPAIEPPPVETYRLGTLAHVYELDGVLLAAQPSREDILLAKQKGVKTIINLRHAAETADFDARQAAAEEDLNYVHIPFTGPGDLTDSVFDSVRKHLKSEERPILLYCSSANRVGAVWLPYRVLDEGLPYNQALAEATHAGLRSPELEKRARMYIHSRQERF